MTRICGPLAEDGLAGAGGIAGRVIGGGAFDDEGHIGMGQGGGCFGAAAADFLLHGGDAEDATGCGIRCGGKLLESGDGDSDADAIIEGLGAEKVGVGQRRAGGIRDGDIPGAQTEDFFGVAAARRADVDVELIEAQDLGFFDFAEEMRWGGRDDAEQLATGTGPHAQPLGEQGMGPPSAERHEGEESGVGDAVHHKADFIEVGGHHDARSGVGGRPGGEFAEQRAEAIGAQRAEGREFAGDDGAWSVFVAGGAVGFGEFPKERKGGIFHGRVLTLRR